jgi:hypothetical protein
MLHVRNIDTTFMMIRYNVLKNLETVKRNFSQSQHLKDMTSKTLWEQYIWVPQDWQTAYHRTQKTSMWLGNSLSKVP